MTKKISFIKVLKIIFLVISLFFAFNKKVLALNYQIQISPVPCPLGNCPTALKEIVSCTSDYQDFLNNPISQHFWVLDQEVTSQGKANERARQFIYWLFQRGAVDEHPVLKQIWRFSANIVFFLIIVVIAILGIGIIIGQRSNFDFRVKFWPIFTKIGLILLYTAFSATIVLTLINISEVLMKFFVESYGGKQLFNIYFHGDSVEKNYTDFIGCRDLNVTVQESANTELFLLRLTNITYYVMGIMIVIRKIVLWFFLFLSPFLSLLIPFNFIRNIGWVWIGVFFQWLFYGPLFALFLNALIRIWSVGIPFIFFFGRSGQETGYIYPTAFNLVYGGPAQIGNNSIGALNSLNYIDTFAEYVIALIMLWVVIILPWWLLRIFRDYCCDGIVAAKNILMSIYDQMRGGPTPGSPTPPGQQIPTTVSLKIPQKIEIPVKVKLETIEEIKKAKTEEIIRQITISREETNTKLTNIAQFETNKQIKENVTKNLDYLANPMKAETPTEKQKFMNIRNELYNRAVKNDYLAKHVLSTISSSAVEKIQKRQEMVQSIPKAPTVAHFVSNQIKTPEEHVNKTITSFINNIIDKTKLINDVSQETNIDSKQVQQTFQSFIKNINQPITEIFNKISQETHLEKEKVATILKTFGEKTASTPNVLPQEKEIAKQMQTIAESDRKIEETIPVPPSVAIEDYENVKKMWKKQYQEGEVPVTENIKSRQEWVDKDIVFITNTLNKLVSPNPEIKEQGLDDLSYILPVLLLNNLKGEEILVYLKAKLEAAKTVAELFEKEKEVAAKLKEKAEEELVEIKPKQKEAAKQMEIKQELKLPEEEKKPIN